MWLIGEAMLALGNAELIGVEDTLSLRKNKKERRGKHRHGGGAISDSEAGSRFKEPKKNVKRICYISLTFSHR